MANEEHLAVLRQGVEVWNEWREENPEIKPNLRDSDLSGADLRWVNLRDSYLVKADFSKTDLRESDLSEADISRANLNRANLSRAALFEADLSGADLSEAKLIMANLSGTRLIGANLCETNLSKVCLIRTQALETNFQRATLTGATIEDWNINSQTILDDVICDYVYLKPNKQERRPHDSNKNFAPGEFTKLFQKVVETVDLIFKDGIDWQAFLTSFQKLQVECGSDELSIQAIEKKSGGAFVIRVEVPADANKAEVEKSLKREYEYQLKAIEEKYRLQLDVKDEQLTFYHKELLVKRQENTRLIGIVETMAEKETSKYDLREAKIYGFAPEAKDSNVVSGETVKDNTIVGTQHNYAPEKQDLAEAAAEIQQLLSQLSQTYPTTTLVEQAVVAEKAIQQIEDDPTLKQRVIAALKAGTIEAFMEIIDNPVVNVMRATLEAWQEGE